MTAALLAPARAAAPAADRCAHCGAACPPGARFCCAGCEGAQALVRGLGLDSFYARRAMADGTLRPEDPAPAAYAALATPLPGGRHRLELMVAGLSCGACVWLVEQALAAEPEVLAARGALSTHRLTVTWQGPAERAGALAALVARLGFRVAPFSPACLRASDDAETRELARALGIAAFGAMNVMLVSVAVWVGSDMGAGTRAALHWLAALIGLPTVLIAGQPLYRRAWAGLRAGRINMDFAVSLGVLATTVMSLSETLRNGDYTWFDGATALLALLLAGRLLDRAARRRARQAAAELLALQEGQVTRLTAAGSEIAAVDAVRPGDRLLVAAGERLRLDGRLDSGSALLDTSAVTGESLPRRFAAGAVLPAGAINMGAPFVQAVTHAAADGSLAALARLLEAAEQARGRFRSIADRAAAAYVPVVHAVAAATFLGWWLGMGVAWQAALVPAVAALIVTCPCGLAIAVPAVQVVAAGRLFRRGVLVATPTALERLARVQHVVLDKTGTLTEGRPALLPGAWTEADLAAAARLAAASRHPLARALAAARPGVAPAPGTVEHPGQGLVRDSGQDGEARLGSAGFLGLPADGVGMTLWWRAAPDRAPVAFRFADRLRPEASALVDGLRRLGLGVELLSGDAAPAVASVAAQLGIADWRAGVTPAAKAARLAALRDRGLRVLMVGDGINDAAALAIAHAAAVPGEASDVASCAADLVLRSGPGALPEAIATARAARRIAAQNIGFSLAYNLVAIPTAILGFCTPLIAALVMASSSLIVIGNALRLGRGRTA
jgi:Cu2+-exporting ATPase